MLGVSIAGENVVFAGEDVELGGLIVFECLKLWSISIVYESPKISIGCEKVN